MTDLRTLRASVVNAVQTATGKRTYPGFTTSYTFPFFVIDFTEITYNVTAGGAVRVLVEVIGYAAINDQSQSELDAAFSPDTDVSVIKALADTPGFRSVRAGDFGTYIVNEQPVALSGRLFAEYLIT